MIISKKGPLGAVAAAACAVGLISAAAAPASADTRSGNLACATSQTANLIHSVKISAPANVPSTHTHDSSGKSFSFTGVSQKRSTNGTSGGATGYQIYSPYTLVSPFASCGPRPV